MYSVSHIAGMPKEISKAKIACLDFSLQKAKMQLGVSVVIDDPEKLEAIRKRYIESVMYTSCKNNPTPYDKLHSNILTHTYTLCVP